MVETHRLAPGTMVTTNVRLQRPLGAGGMGAVWVADHLGLNTEVAVKFVSAEMLARAPSMLERFRHEAAAAATIRSPHVVQMFDHGTMQDGTPFIVMELLDGESLGDRLARTGTLSSEELVEIVRQTAKALTDAHGRGIVHRDIKPDNIFLTASAGEVHVKVLDFGIAKNTETLNNDQQLTGAGMVLGTPNFMSPEQLTRATSASFQCDLWALSVVVYRAFTGRMPFLGETLGGLIVAVNSCRFTPPSQLLRRSMPEMDAWFARAFQREPHARFPTAKALAETLRQVLVHHAAPISGARNIPTPTVPLGPASPTTPLGLGHPTAPLEVAPPIGSNVPMTIERNQSEAKAARIAVAAAILATLVAVIASVVLMSGDEQEAAAAAEAPIPLKSTSAATEADVEPDDEPDHESAEDEPTRDEPAADEPDAQPSASANIVPSAQVQVPAGPLPTPNRAGRKGRLGF